MVELTDKQKLALYKKSQSSGVSTDILEEVYIRGYELWNESFTGNAEQFGFDRVNSFIAGGYALELDSDLLEGKRGLWDNIHAKRERIKRGSGEKMRKPGSKGAPTAADFKAAQEEYDFNETTPSTIQTIKRVIAEATYKGKKVPLNKPMKGDVKKSKVYVDPDGDGKAQKVNFGDKTLSIKKNIPARKKSYCARSSGQGNLNDKTSANYWSRRAWDC